MKIIFLDADGTLFHPKGFIPTSAKEAIYKAQANGHKIILCTGRQKSEIYGDLTSIEYDGVVLGSGALVMAKDTILKDVAFSQKQKDIIIEYMSSHSIGFFFEMNEGLLINEEGMQKMEEIYINYCKGLSEEEKKINGVTRLYTTVIPTSYEDMKTCNANKVTFLESDIPFIKIKNDLSDTFDVIPCTFTPLGKESGELADLHLSKANGMDVLIEYFNIDRKDVIAIGDGENDIPMLKNAHVAIAMENGKESVKKVADYITSSIDEDGIYNAFKHYNLI
ncbi:MAG: Cof-type HAD-IIB family hydrolase [Holdemanella sp.]|nr:Cof-type HAD-IIB family hydrolase [Holdemanella sp.]